MTVTHSPAASVQGTNRLLFVPLSEAVAAQARSENPSLDVKTRSAFGAGAPRQTAELVKLPLVDFAPNFVLQLTTPKLPENGRGDKAALVVETCCRVYTAVASTFADR